MGKLMGNVMKMKILTSQSVLAPMYSPCREHAACGMISPNTTIANVEIIPPTTPLVNEARRMAISAALKQRKSQRLVIWNH